MATTEERLEKMSDAVRETCIELLGPSASGNRTERSVLPELYRTMSEDDRKEVHRRCIANCFNDEEKAYTTERINGLEEDYFGKSALNF